MKLIYNKSIALLVLLVLVFQSCHNDDIVDVPYGNLIITIEFEEAYSGFSKDNILVNILDQDDNIIATANTNTEGVANFPNLVNDTYKVNITHNFEANTVFDLLGLNQELTFIGVSESVLVSSFQDNQQTIVLKTNKVGGFVIKEVYNSNAGGGIDFGGIYQYVRYNDGFIEIYNNSPETLYADGLQIGIMSNEYEDVWRTDNEHAYLEQVFTIPGDGTTYPVLAGESIVIAATAINHINAEGLSSEQLQDLYLFGTVEKSVDLSNANFETYFNGFAQNYDIDVANVPNLEVSFNTEANVKEISMTNRGNSYAIFQNVDLDALESVEIPRGNIEIRYYHYLKLPNQMVTDAFESQDVQNFPEAVVGEHLEVQEAWEGKSYRRIISTEINNRKVLLDTDNCVGDFEIIDHATPGSFD